MNQSGHQEYKNKIKHYTKNRLLKVKNSHLELKQITPINAFIGDMDNSEGKELPKKTTLGTTGMIS